METKQGLKTTDIKGKAYVEVNQRIQFFRENYDGWSLTTEIVSLENGVVIMKAQCVNEQGVVVSIGHAYEKEGSTFINKTSFIENCETSAVGRALGNLGIGIDTSVASAEEVGNAIKQQNEPPKSEFHGKTEEEAKELAIKKGLASVLQSLKKEENKAYKPLVMKSMCDKYDVDKWGHIKFEDYDKFIKEVKEELQNQKDLENAGI